MAANLSYLRRSRSPSLQSSPQSRFSCRIVDIDSYLTSPLRHLDVTYSDFAGEPIKQLPVIRIFGATPSGQKACVHVHGAFPYLYVPCASHEPTDSYLKLFGRSIDHALQVTLGAGSKDERHVFKISVVKGIPFYGYHAVESVFLKIYLFNPAYIKRLADLLLTGAIMSIPFQAHESHIPFVLQFMIDYGLYGMNFIHSSDVKFRIGGDGGETDITQKRGPSPVTSLSSSVGGFISPSNEVWQLDNLPENMLIQETRISTCELEVDIVVTDIMNREEISTVTGGGYPGLIALWEEEQKRREILSLEDRLSPPPSPERTCSLVHEAEERHKALLLDIIKRRGAPSPSPLSLHSHLLDSLSQSCDPEVHSASSTNSNDHDLTPPIDTPTEVLVDEDRIDQSLRLTKKLSSVSISSSQAELVGLLVDIMQSPPILDQTLIPEEVQLASQLTATMETSSTPVKRKVSQSSSSSASIFSVTSDQTSQTSLKNKSIRSPAVDETNLATCRTSLSPDGSQRQLFDTSDQQLRDTTPSTDDVLKDFSESQIPLSQLQTGSCLDELRSTPLSSQARPSAQLLNQERKRLVQLCRESGDEESDVEEESDNELMTQPFTVDDDDQGPRPEVEFIPQLDGSSSKKKSLKLTRKSKGGDPKLRPSGLVSEPGDTGLKPESGDTGLKPESEDMGLTPESGDTGLTPEPGGMCFRLELSPEPETGPLDMIACNNPRKRSISESSSEATPTSKYSSKLAIRALKHSLVPKVRKLTRSESAQYFTPPRNERKRKAPSSQDTPKRVSKRTRRSMNYRKWSGSEEDEMMSIAIAESLRTLERETRMREMNETLHEPTREKRTQESVTKDTSAQAEEMIAGDMDTVTAVENVARATSAQETVADETVAEEIVAKEAVAEKMIAEDMDTVSAVENVARATSAQETVADETVAEEIVSEETVAEKMVAEDMDTVPAVEKDTSAKETVAEESIAEERKNDLASSFERPRTPELMSEDDIEVSPVKRDMTEDTVNEFQLLISTSSDSDSNDEREETTVSLTPLETSSTHVVSWKGSDEGNCVLYPQEPAPSLEYLKETAPPHVMPLERHSRPFWGVPTDTQPPQDIGGQSIYVPSLMPYELPEFDTGHMTADGRGFTLEHWRTVIATYYGATAMPPSCHGENSRGSYTAQDHQRDVQTRSQFWPKGSRIITPLLSPPDPLFVRNQLASQTVQLQTPSDENSHLEGPSLDNTFGFQFTPTTTVDTSTVSEVQFITSMSVELHVRTRHGLRPDPEWDPVLALFYYIHNDWPLSTNNGCGSTDDGCGDANKLSGIIAIDLSSSNIQTTPTKDVKSSPSKKSPQKSSKATSTKLKVGVSPTKNLLGNLLKNDPRSQKIEEIGATTDNDRRPFLEHCGLTAAAAKVTFVSNEKDLFDELIKLVRRADPDILVGYEVQKGSWGYLRNRASQLGLDLIGQISRVPTAKRKAVPVKLYESRYGSGSGLHVQGRVMLDVWRTMKHEISLTGYSFENLSYHVLHKRFTKFSYQTLTEWYEHRNRLYRHRVVDYYMVRCCGNWQLLEKFNLIGRTSELARLYGIEFYNVLARGSQYRVESMMLRLAKQFNYIAVSPSIQQRARMAAPECLQLIMEPESKFYVDPVLVLDFQSLYPSMVIAYNYCYSTCLGRVKHLASDGNYTFGTCTLNMPNQLLKQLKDDVTISPNGIVFVKPEVRKGILPRMLEEILNTRIMVKQSMKLHRNNKVLQRLLDARQLGLKLIANVTYGYTAASYSGRMPCVEIADSIVRKGRETLERAIRLVNSTPEWQARVVYGDTDSMFVLLKGATKEEAFRIGREISERVTAENPKPVKLKFEKVYLPCILETKKRYAGYMYESLAQTEPVFDAKGIETVRRDGCPAVVKILEKSLRLLFSTKDLSLVKTYVQQQCSKIMDGKVSLQELTLAKEYRGREGYRPGACVPALELAKRSVAIDRWTEPLVGERVPYVIVYDTPGLPLIQLVRRPEEVLSNPCLRLNATYYITKQILPPLDRAFSLLGVNVYQWYAQLPRTQRVTNPLPTVTTGGGRKGTISQYFVSMHCPICENLTKDGVCAECSGKPHRVVATLSSQIHRSERTHISLCQLCQHCCGEINPGHYLECISLDCPVLYSRQTSFQRLNNATTLQRTLDNFLAKHSLS